MLRAVQRMEHWQSRLDELARRLGVPGAVLGISTPDWAGVAPTGVLNSACESNFQSTGTVVRSDSTTTFFRARSGETSKPRVRWALFDGKSNVAFRCGLDGAFAVPEVADWPAFSLSWRETFCACFPGCTPRDYGPLMGFEVGD